MGISLIRDGAGESATGPASGAPCSSADGAAASAAAEASGPGACCLLLDQAVANVLHAYQANGRNQECDSTKEKEAVQLQKLTLSKAVL